MDYSTVPYTSDYTKSWTGSALGGLLGYDQVMAPLVAPSGGAAAGGADDPYHTISNDTTTNNTTQQQSGPTAAQIAAAQAKAATLGFLGDQGDQLRALLARTQTGLDQGLQGNEDQYNEQTGRANQDKERAYAGYADQRVGQNQGKLDAYQTINRNANNGFRSLSQIIGRAAGRGSSAFQDLLPDVIGKDTSTKRAATNDTFGRNLQGIDKAQGQYDISFEDMLGDLLKQKKTNESNLRTGIEGQRQGINAQLGKNAADISQANGGDYAAIQAAQNPYQNAINSSKDAVEGFFNTFRSPFTAKTAVAATPDLAGYTTDRSNVNATAQNGDPTNPYSSLLRKKLQGIA